MRDCSCHSHNGLLTAKGRAAAAQRLSLEGLVPRGELEYVDRVDSVSALAEAEGAHVFDDELIDEQYRRFLNG